MQRWARLETSVARWSTRSSPTASRAFSSSRAGRVRQRIEALLARTDAIDDVEVSGWIRSVRKQKKVTFVAVGDGSTITSLQAVLTPEQSIRLTHGLAVTLRGAWVKSAGKSQSNELQVAAVDIPGHNDAEGHPIQPKYQTAEFLRTVPHLRAQVPANGLLLQLRSKLTAALTQWFDEQGFVQCHTPVITSSDCEGAGEVFSLQTSREAEPASIEPFFHTPKYLTVSAQLHLEALSQAVDKVWTLSPTFRAEKSDTQRHLSEFYMLEAEISFTNQLDTVMSIVEDMLRAATSKLHKTSLFQQIIQSRSGVGKTELVGEAEIRQRWDGLTREGWPRITYADAVDILVKAASSGLATFIIPPKYDDGLAAEHERYIAATIGAGSPVFVTHYPSTQKPFYMARSEDKLAACFDLLVPDLCELAGGSIREHDLAALETAMASKGVSGDGLDWYKDLRRYGSVPHGGFGLGYDRLLCYLAGIPNVKDMVSFPRYHGRCDC